MPTIKDIARHAGVSAATVSRCLNVPELVRVDRRRRVEDAIAELGYVPHPAARALAHGRSRMVGALFPRLNSHLFGSFMGPLQEALRNSGYTLVVAGSDYDEGVEYEQALSLVNHGVDALILIGLAHAERTFELLERRCVTSLFTWCWHPQVARPQVGFCNRTAAGMVTEHLLDLGHREIGMISGSPAGNDRARDRILGVRDVLQAAGRALSDERLVMTRFDVHEGARALNKLMRRAVPPTAVICGSDLFAFGALHQARRLGIRVPDELSITGFDDTDLAAVVTPPLTTVRTPREEMAERCAEHILARLGGRGEPDGVELATELDVRQNTRSRSL